MELLMWNLFPTPKSQLQFNRYKRFIESRPIHEVEQVVERHHIFPRWLKRIDEDWNLINLTPREHFIAHKLLWKSYRDKPSWSAYWAMGMMGTYNLTSREYNTLKEQRSKEIRGENHNMFGRKRPDLTLRNQLLNPLRKGVPRPDVSKALKGRKREDISKLRTGRKWDEKTKAKMKESQRLRRLKEKCPLLPDDQP